MYFGIWLCTPVFSDCLSLLCSPVFLVQWFCGYHYSDPRSGHMITPVFLPWHDIDNGQIYSASQWLSLAPRLGDCLWVFLSSRPLQLIKSHYPKTAVESSFFQIPLRIKECFRDHALKTLKSSLPTRAKLWYITVWIQDLIEASDFSPFHYSCDSFQIWS